MYLYAFDRQGIIRSDGTSITADFPRFLICLLYFHCASVKACGAPWVDPASYHNLPFEKLLDPDCKNSLFPPAEATDFKTQHFSENQAISVSGAIHNEKVHSPDISVPEVQKPPEVDRAVNHFAFLDESEQRSLFNRSPAVRLSVGLQAQNMLRAERALETLGERHRILRVVVSEELVPLTSQTGKSFVDAWLDAVTCTFHFVLLRLAFQWSLIICLF